MAHFAELQDNKVINVIVVSNNDVENKSFPESEAIGINYLNILLPGRTWKQTSYNNNFRFRYAGIGYEWHPECGDYGGFCPAKPYEDWIFDNDQCLWVAPIPMPTEDLTKVYIWDPEIHNWKVYE